MTTDQAYFDKKSGQVKNISPNFPVRLNDTDLNTHIKALTDFIIDRPARGNQIIAYSPLLISGNNELLNRSNRKASKNQTQLTVISLFLSLVVLGFSLVQFISAKDDLVNTQIQFEEWRKDQTLASERRNVLLEKIQTRSDRIEVIRDIKNILVTKDGERQMKTLLEIKDVLNALLQTRLNNDTAVRTNSVDQAD